ncbi:hypothetical protein Ade02nite_52670 [Paractinoplanes deccanensis]|uniref:Uncharacterized protein n=1 Tax=Paractinoplanes deccanensis TaxID=113561 RepID=A0ABQ3Y9E3_9ACTN|nr:hypothetical protein Ade02nite_52670 [Actinoplanes deccanensis]
MLFVPVAPISSRLAEAADNTEPTDVAAEGRDGAPPHDAGRSNRARRGPFGPTVAERKPFGPTVTPPRDTPVWPPRSPALAPHPAPIR